MKSLLVWVGVLVASAALGIGLYAIVMRPAESADASVAASPAPTVSRIETGVVTDPPERRVVDLPSPVQPTPPPDVDDRRSPQPTPSAAFDDDGQADDDHGDDSDQHDADRRDDGGRHDDSGDHADD